MLVRVSEHCPSDSAVLTCSAPGTPNVRVCLRLPQASSCQIQDGDSAEYCRIRPSQDRPTGATQRVWSSFSSPVPRNVAIQFLCYRQMNSVRPFDATTAAGRFEPDTTHLTTTLICWSPKNAGHHRSHNRIDPPFVLPESESASQPACKRGGNKHT